MLLIEDSHYPLLYVPIADVNLDVLIPNTHTSFCPRKGNAAYWDFQYQGKTIANIAWAYLEPIAGARPIKDHMAFYEKQFDWVCTNYG